MSRGTGIALGTSLAFACGVVLGACAQEDQPQKVSKSAAVAQTTQATLPVVTVYKSPT